HGLHGPVGRCHGWSTNPATSTSPDGASRKHCTIQHFKRYNSLAAESPVMSSKMERRKPSCHLRARNVHQHLDPAASRPASMHLDLHPAHT
ncbi:hypothetical protein VIGAN_06181400, partial [Vigna angularis var. angularis]